MRADAKIIFTGPSPRGWHRLQQASECLQKYAWTYPHEIDGNESAAPGELGKGAALSIPAEPASPPLAKGSLIHLALAQHYVRMQAEQNGTDVEDWCEPTRAVKLIARVTKAEPYVDLVLALYERYCDRYPDDIHTMRILEVEEMYETMIGGKYRLTGRMDLVIEDSVGRILVIDHKTTGRLTSSHPSYYTVSGQLLGYRHLAQRKWGDRFAGLHLNLIQHGSEPKFERLALPRSPNMESRFEQTVVDIEESIIRMKATGRAYDDWPKAMTELVCVHRYGPCEFTAQCRHGAGAKTAGNWLWEG